VNITVQPQNKIQFSRSPEKRFALVVDSTTRSHSSMLNDWINPVLYLLINISNNSFNHPSQDKQHNNKSPNK